MSAGRLTAAGRGSRAYDWHDGLHDLGLLRAEGAKTVREGRAMRVFPCMRFPMRILPLESAAPLNADAMRVFRDKDQGVCWQSSRRGHARRRMAGHRKGAADPVTPGRSRPEPDDFSGMFPVRCRYPCSAWPCPPASLRFSLKGIAAAVCPALLAASPCQTCGPGQSRRTPRLRRSDRPGTGRLPVRSFPFRARWLPAHLRCGVVGERILQAELFRQDIGNTLENPGLLPAAEPLEDAVPLAETLRKLAPGRRPSGFARAPPRRTAGYRPR